MEQSPSNVDGWIFDIQRYSVHDGPGIRTTVFLSGCPLRCMWCQNPESYEMKPQISYRIESCRQCGACVSACPAQAVTLADNGVRTDTARCTACGTCVKACPAGARSIIGRRVSDADVFEEVRSDKIFYEGSGGGVTLSGGEVLMQKKFAKSVLRRCREDGIHTAIETSGYADWDVFRDLLSEVDLLMIDLKHIDSEAHARGTGIGNEVILRNLKSVRRELPVSITIRVPVIPRFNDSPENMARTAAFVADELGIDIPVCLLPYHRMGIGKRVQLERKLPDFETETPSGETMELIKRTFESKGLSTKIGG